MAQLNRDTADSQHLLVKHTHTHTHHTHTHTHTHTRTSTHPQINTHSHPHTVTPPTNDYERWGAGVETQKNVRGEIGGWGRVPFNENYAPSLSTIYDGA